MDPKLGNLSGAPARLRHNILKKLERYEKICRSRAVQSIKVQSTICHTEMKCCTNRIKRRLIAALFIFFL